jgi:hypothetical protein
MHFDGPNGGYYLNVTEWQRVLAIYDGDSRC